MKKIATTDHYKTLGIPRDATRAEIRKAFRAMAKKCHPDRNSGREEWATDQMRLVIEAHRVLSDTSLRATYDRERELVAEIAQKKSNLRPKGRPEGQNPRACAERVLYDLLAGDVAQAVKDYERLVSAVNRFDLTDHLDAHDWLDCKFLLAEAYERRSQFEKAFAMYEDLYKSPAAQRRAAFFRHEVRDRMVRICCQGPSRRASPQESVGFYMRALALDLPRNRQAFFHKKIAECCMSAGDDESARRHLGIAFQLKPDLKGVTKICNRLNFSPTRQAAS